MLTYAEYRKAIETVWRTGVATEHSYRPALEGLLKGEAWGGGGEVINEPKRNQEVGAPDFVVRRRAIAVGFVEAKDIDANLDKIEKDEQLQRYRAALSALILTNQIEFRLYLDGELKFQVEWGRLDKRTKKIDWLDKGEEGLRQLFAFFADATDSAATIKRADDLAKKMAARAVLVRHLIAETLVQEKAEARHKKVSVENLPLHEQLAGFRDVLIRGLDEAQFADMFAQTIAYGLFAARFHKKPEETFTREIAAFRIPASNPFLQKTFQRIGGADLDERIAWAVDDLAELLNRTDLDAVRAHMGEGTGRDDPVIHFYETFLDAYAPEMREDRGVYYTPSPVVRFIVRGIDDFLKTKFGVERGFADDSRIDGRHRITILDPACGTGTFLHEVVRHVETTYFAGNLGAWPNWFKKELLPRLYGFEFLMAPYAIAHLSLEVALDRVKLAPGERFNVFLTNTLEEPQILETAPMFARWLADEANAASRVKTEHPVMVILGNPPYSRNSLNPSTVERLVVKGEGYEVYDKRDPRPERRIATKDQTVDQRTFIGHLLRGWDPLAETRVASYFEVEGQYIDERNPKSIGDDYVKFLRFAQWKIERAGQGIVGFVTNRGYLWNDTLRGVRNALYRAFDEIYVLDLHGGTSPKETSPFDMGDENVFDIMTGVAIVFLVRLPGDHVRAAKVFRQELWGPRVAESE
ncbi:MAG: N-6 DNA methylase [Tagaea sp.]|nr:N-6 DNA methylase [Tagaea sp.]